MSYIDISRYALFGLAAVAGLSVAATDPGITLVAGEAQARQVANTSVDEPSFSYRVSNGAPTIKVRTRDYIFCANSGHGSAGTDVHLDVQREGFVFGTVKTNGQPTVVKDVRDFSYGKGGPVVRVSAAASGSSILGSLVCLAMDNNAERHHVGSGLFADPFESPHACSEQTSASCSMKFNSSVKVEAVDYHYDGTEAPYMHYFLAVEFDNIPLSNGPRLVLRDGYDAATFNDAKWCMVDRYTVQSGLAGFDLSEDCVGSAHSTTETVDTSFVPSGSHGSWVGFYVRRYVKSESPSPPATADRPVIAAAIFPDPAVEEMRTDDNVAGYPSNDEEITQFQQFLDNALLHLEAQSTWQ